MKIYKQLITNDVILQNRKLSSKGKDFKFFIWSYQETCVALQQPSELIRYYFYKTYRTNQEKT